MHVYIYIYITIIYICVNVHVYIYIHIYIDTVSWAYWLSLVSPWVKTHQKSWSLYHLQVGVEFHVVKVTRFLGIPQLSPWYCRTVHPSQHHCTHCEWIYLLQICQEVPEFYVSTNVSISVQCQSMFQGDMSGVQTLLTCKSIGQEQFQDVGSHAVNMWKSPEWTSAHISVCHPPNIQHLQNGRIYE